MKLDFLLIITVIGIMFAISLPATYSEMQSNSNQILQEDNTIIQKQTNLHV